MDKDGIFSRTEMILGKEQTELLSRSSVIVFGLGGVGSYTAEALVRTGIGRIALVDSDTVVPSNINRQLIATENTVSMKKTLAAKERFLSVNPKIEIETYDEYFDENSKIDIKKYDYIVDAIDSVSSKIYLAEKAEKEGIPIISCLSAGNKLDATRFRVGDIYSTSVCPLARVMRKKLKERGVKKLKTVWSDETPCIAVRAEESENGEEKYAKKIGSLAYVTGVAGLIAAGEVILDLTLRKGENK